MEEYGIICCFKSVDKNGNVLQESNHIKVTYKSDSLATNTTTKLLLANTLQADLLEVAEEQNVEYVYDANNRLTKIMSNNITLFKFTYDKNGNLLNTTAVENNEPTISYSTHIQDYGWLDYVSNGEVSGTQGESKRMEAINIILDSNISGGVSYKTHVEDYGWLDTVSDGAISGTLGQSKRMEAIQIYLTGEIANQYDIYYRVHAQEVGWMGWAKNGESAGTSGYSYRMEAIQIVLVAKGEAAPGSTDGAFLQR